MKNHFFRGDRIIECHIKEVPFGLQSFLSSMPLWMSKNFHEIINRKI